MLPIEGFIERVTAFININVVYNFDVNNPRIINNLCNSSLVYRSSPVLALISF